MRWWWPFRKKYYRMRAEDWPEGNAYGAVVLKEYRNGKPVPVICAHGGSMWMCRRCALVGPKTRFSTPEEYKWIRWGNQEIPFEEVA